MHASIFTLTLMSSERYAAVVRPLDMVQRSKGYRKVLALGTWLLALLLALPMMLAIRLSQRASFTQTRRLPNPRVLYLILGIVLLFWACFLPFWLWQLLTQYRGTPPLTPRSARIVNYLTTCLTYSNSCVNPFLYTLLTKNYRDYRQRSLQGRGAHRPVGIHSFPQGRTGCQRGSGRSLSSSSQRASETIALSQAAPRGLCT
ncbi:hypothetical protein E2I00_012870 [Balaenoptera physalus]|uniref:G-protein coupled receptors family 1 profile domain-containing protein n=1 Tax=Balaenoptera physalus TaxID=9770 RepID=A0A643CCE3_BALPH|nr:hypothetical protein E2I00_012870 [Balaenoptera physalus]